MPPLKIVLVLGSLRPKSATAAMLCFVEEKLKAMGAEVQQIDLGKNALPLYEPGSAKQDPGYLAMQPTVLDADCFVLGTPDYHGTPSGAMKNFLDYFWKEFTGKLFGYVCASHEKGLSPMDTLRIAVRQCYGWSLPYGVSGNDHQDVEPGGEVLNRQLADRLTMLAHDMVSYGSVIQARRELDLQGSAPGFLAALRPATS